jgi:cation transport regulator ChaC
MPFDTRATNKHRQNLSEYEQIWVFGYGSLIYKVDFDYIACTTGYIKDFQRRFWQGSHDHRGTQQKPGRVLTLVPVCGAKCFGKAFHVSADVFDHLDHREKNGYLRHEVDLYLPQKVVKGLVYIADQNNPAYLGYASIEQIAKHIYHSAGPSGQNRDYVYGLADALRKHKEADEHVFAVEKQLRIFA